MNELLTKTFDFGIRIVELVSYLEEEKKHFPLIGRMLECGTGIGINLRISKEMAKNQLEGHIQAYRLSLETEYLLELLVKTGFLYEKQSVHLLQDCRFIRDEITKRLAKQIK